MSDRMLSITDAINSTQIREMLREVHELRMQAHWGKNADLGPWPKTDAEWRQTAHGAPWDTNVYMAIWHRNLARQIFNKGLL